MRVFNNDADMLGTSFYGYAKSVVTEVLSLGRCGTLVDWESGGENRAYASLYLAEDIRNWRVERINGRNVTTLVVLREETGDWRPETGGDFFEGSSGEQIRVLRLDGSPETGGGSGDQSLLTSAATGGMRCVVDVWRPKRVEAGGTGGEGSASAKASAQQGWEIVETRVPLRQGKPLPFIPFVFHGPEHSRPPVCNVPLDDLIMLNLCHYRVDADYKHGLHFTALPTAWVTGFPSDAALKIGSSVAWQSETPGATAGFLEFSGQGLGPFEKALDHIERLMTILGSRLLEGQKRISETAEAAQIRVAGEESVLTSLAASVSESLTQVLRLVYWWNSTEEQPEDVGDKQALVDLNMDFRSKGLSAAELTALVAAWQSGAISRDTMYESLRRAAILPEGRTNAEEGDLVAAGLPQLVALAKELTPGALASSTG